MIITLTLNPAIDKTVIINDFNLNKVNRIDKIRLDVGGKGINVSKVINTLCGDSNALGILAGTNGAFIKDYLNKVKIKNDFIMVPGETRTNLKIIDEQKNTYTDINENFKVNKDYLKIVEEKLVKYLDSSTDDNNIVVLSGSVPVGFGSSTYKDIISKISNKNAKVLLDADGKLFAEGVQASPYFIKPNLEELNKAYNVKLSTHMDIVHLVRNRIISLGVNSAMVSLGGDGALYINSNRAIYVKGIRVNVKSTVGAGDSMVAAFAYSLEKNYSIENSIKLASATSTANIMTEGTQSGRIDDIKEIYKHIILQEIGVD